MASKKLLNKTVCVVGPGYVGLPLAEAFAEHLRTIGYRRDSSFLQGTPSPYDPVREKNVSAAKSSVCCSVM